MSITLLGFALVAAPWILTLSLKYRGFVISTSGKISHAIVGPPDVERHHPLYRTFHVPEPGRITAWEDPDPKLYAFWSPFENLRYAKHQLKLIYYNAKRAVDVLSGFDWLRLGLCAALCGFLIHTPWRRNMAVERWRWAGLPVICIPAIYLPVFAYEQRYYYPVYPFLLAASTGIVVSLARDARKKLNVPRLIGLILFAFSFANHPRSILPRTLKGQGVEFPVEMMQAHDMAKRLKAAGVRGPVTGTYLSGEGVTLYIAFLIDQPWYGG
ncbi:MAG: hypothetical protein NZT92_10880, partial [Abditibacteriales bacterium]|nr:hypothetical protein [Abditibacteriales bacterium]MDW8366922.1 hypothetical protein [Abditibacteriales bacterium]